MSQRDENIPPFILISGIYIDPFGRWGATYVLGREFIASSDYYDSDYTAGIIGRGLLSGCYPAMRERLEKSK